ncbi:Uncharacterised protein [Algoriella xinjiangensis]|uniref:helix-turn-helix transcriptional regulator n=1 Tax=Algoriella xinjiangensis TaxID=684065 RepID=UPI000F634364|nr:hypothetical protein [Algoriella xinjiangensis]VDH15642.1 Uncharacterised protein [Algoriella xinjiangensis]
MEQIQFISVSPEQFLAEVEKVVKKCLLAYDKQAKIEAQQKEVLTRKEVQELLSVSPTTLYNWEKESVLCQCELNLVCIIQERQLKHILMVNLYDYEKDLF